MEGISKVKCYCDGLANMQTTYCTFIFACYAMLQHSLINLYYTHEFVNEPPLTGTKICYKIALAYWSIFSFIPE